MVYTYSLAATVLLNLPSPLNHQISGSTTYDSVQADGRSSGLLSIACLSRRITRFVVPAQTLSHAYIVVLSGLYGLTSAVSCWLSVLYIYTAAFIGENSGRPVGVSKPHFIPSEAKVQASENLQNFVSTVQRKAPDNAAD